MYDITVVIPISRDTYLNELFDELNSIIYNFKHIELLAIVDGDNKLYNDVVVKVEESKYDNSKVIKFKTQNQKLEYNIPARRVRIAQIHNFAKSHIGDSEYVVGFEDDTLMPNYAIEALIEDYDEYPNAGMIQGVELGRWGIPYVGAWRFDSIENPTEINSTPVLDNIQEVDAGGLYCFITKTETYIEHEFKPFGSNDLGPDVDFGYTLRKNGYKNYTDYNIPCIHRNKERSISIDNTKPSIITFKNKDGRWRLHDSHTS